MSVARNDWSSYYSIDSIGACDGLYVTASNTGSISQTTNDLNVTGSLTLNGQNVGDMLKEIQERLAIITPDHGKMSKFPALQKAYEHYKLVEALCQEQSDDDTSGT